MPSAEEESAYEEEDLPDPRKFTSRTHNLLFSTDRLIPDTIWGYRAASDCLFPVAKAVLATKAPGYDTILELDEKVRQLPISGTVALHVHRPQTDKGFRIFSRSHYHELSESNQGDTSQSLS